MLNMFLNFAIHFLKKEKGKTVKFNIIFITISFTNVKLYVGGLYVSLDYNQQVILKTTS